MSTNFSRHKQTDLRMHVVFSLPADIWRENILAFFALKDIVRSFNAFSNHKVQKQFRTLTNGHTLTSPMSVANGQVNILKWCASQNILPDNLMLWDEFDLPTASILPVFCERTSTLSLGFWKQVAQPITCARLHSFELYKCTFQSLVNLRVFSYLEIMSFEGCSNLTSASLMNSLARCRQLKRCTISNCDLIEASVVALILNHNTRLESLHLRGSHLHQYSLASILASCNRQTHPSLRNLVLRDCIVCNPSFRLLAVCFPLLKQLQLSGAGNNVHNADVEFLVQRCPHLTDLALDGCTKLDNVALLSIALHLRSLQHLSVAHCRNLTNEGVMVIADGCALLEALNILYCVSITDEAVQQVRLKCMQLNNLNVAGCDQLTDAAFSGGASTALRVLNVRETNLTGAFYQHTSTVTELYGMDCPHINHELVQNMVTYGSNVTALFLNATRLCAEELLRMSTVVPLLERVLISHSAANDEVMRSFVKHCPRLRWMNVMGCIAVTIDTVRELQQTRKMHIPM